MDRKQAVDFLVNKPHKFGHLIGFTRLNSLHQKWIKEMVTLKDDKTIQASRGTFKTTCVSIALALIIVLLPNRRTLFMRKTDSDVKEVIKQVAKILKSPQMKYFVQCIYGVELKILTESATEITTNLTSDIKGTAQLVGMGLGSSLTGKHFDIIFTDDIVNVNDRVSKAERERTKIIYQELQNIKNRDGRIFNTGTPWHKDDAFTIMPKPEKYDCYHEEIQKIISREELEELKQQMSPALFAANYELIHIASEDVIFDNPVTGESETAVSDGIMHIDCAYFGEDYTALTVIKKRGNMYYAYGRCWRKHVEDCYEEIQYIYRKFLCPKLYMENNADKGMVARDLKREGLITRTYAETTNKYIKIVTYLKREWRNVVFVEGTDEEYIQQILDYNENAEHDDCPDSLASAIRLLYRK